MYNPLYAVGVGPGDPELLTIKAVRIIRNADILITPSGQKFGESLAQSIVEDLVEPTRQKVLTRYFPMTLDSRRLGIALRPIADEIGGLVTEGQRVVFLTLGDPAMFSTFAYLENQLRELWPGVQIEIVPGITSFAAASAAAGFSLVQGQERLAVVGAGLNNDSFRQLLADFECLVVLKVAQHFDRLHLLLKESGCTDKCVFVKRVGLPGETVIRDLDLVGEHDLDYFSLLLVRR